MVRVFGMKREEWKVLQTEEELAGVLEMMKGKLKGNELGKWKEERYQH
jgi:hypothetical protein